MSRTYIIGSTSKMCSESRMNVREVTPQDLVAETIPGVKVNRTLIEAFDRRPSSQWCIVTAVTASCDLDHRSRVNS
jgi:hypothetical protein